MRRAEYESRKEEFKSKIEALLKEYSDINVGYETDFYDGYSFGADYCIFFNEFETDEDREERERKTSEMKEVYSDLKIAKLVQIDGHEMEVLKVEWDGVFYHKIRVYGYTKLKNGNFSENLVYRIWKKGSEILY